ncbi:MAG: DUF4124 domain-containing protein [Marinobacter sp.]
MMQRLFLVALMALMMPALASAASVYRWTDEDGNVHFGDREPTGHSAERVSVKTGKSGNSQPRKSPQEQVEALDEREAEREKSESESKVEEARRKQRKARCDTARANLDVINSNARIRVAGEDGEQRYLSQEEIQEKKAEFEAIAEESCGEEEKP